MTRIYLPLFLIGIYSACAYNGNGGPRDEGPSTADLPVDDCNEMFTLCLHTSKQSVRGGKHGHSVCWDCKDRCVNEGAWPSKTRDGKDCKWWQKPAKKRRKGFRRRR